MISFTRPPLELLSAIFVNESGANEYVSRNTIFFLLHSLPGFEHTCCPLIVRRPQLRSPQETVWHTSADDRRRNSSPTRSRLGSPNPRVNCVSGPPRPWRCRRQRLGSRPFHYV